MIQPDDDFDNDFDDGDPMDGDDTEVLAASGRSSNQKQHDTRRKIEDMLERKRLREEFGDLEF